MNRPARAFFHSAVEVLRTVVVGSMLLSGGFIGRVYAFDSAEHCSLSNLSAQIAFDFVSERLALRTAPFDRPKEGFADQLQQAKKALLPFSQDPPLDARRQKDTYCPSNWHRGVGKIPFSYGKLVALADFALAPQDLFQSTGELNRLPSNALELNPSYLEAGTLELTLRYLLASHNNLRHFQAPALESFYQLHAEALAAAAYGVDERTRSLFRPLAFSAVADHFLEDVFAPGHMVTPRDGMYDAAALSWHDAFNGRGRVLTVRHWNDLQDIVEFARNNAEARYNSIFQQIGDKSDSTLSRTSLATALTNLAGESELKCFYSQGPVDRLLDPEGKSFTPILDLDTDLLDAWMDSGSQESSKAPSVCVHGDGSLDEHDRKTSFEVASQKALMVLIEARYIIEVLAVFGTQAEERNEISPIHTWCPAMPTGTLFFGKKGGPLTHPSTDEDTQGKPRRSCEQLLRLAGKMHCKSVGNEAKSCSGVYMIPTVVTEYFAYVSTPTPVYQLDLGVFDYRDWLYGLSIGVMSANHGSALTGAAEFGIPMHLVGAAQLAILAGFEERGRNPTSSHAFTWRAIMEVPQIDLAVGPYAKLVVVGNGTDSRVRWAYGARADLGFSILSIYLAVGEEPRLYAPLRTTHGVSIATGISMTVNGRRLWNGTVGLFR